MKEELRKEVRIWGKLVGNFLDRMDRVGPSELRYLLGKLDRVLLNKTRIVFAGDFSAGKTTVVNGILDVIGDQDKSLPVNVAETTAIPTLIRNGKRRILLLPDASTGTHEPATPEEQVQFFSLSPNRINNSPLLKKYLKAQSRVILESPELTTRSIELLDLPGFSSTNDLVDMRAKESLTSADIIALVCNARGGTLNPSLIDTINNHAHSEQSIVVLITFCDTIRPTNTNVILDEITSTANQYLDNPVQKIITTANGYPSKGRWSKILKELQVTATIEEIRELITTIVNTLIDNAGDSEDDSLREAHSDILSLSESLSDCSVRIGNDFKDVGLILSKHHNIREVNQIRESLDNTSKTVTDIFKKYRRHSATIQRSKKENDSSARSLGVAIKLLTCQYEYIFYLIDRVVCNPEMSADYLSEIADQLFGRERTQRLITEMKMGKDLVAIRDIGLHLIARL